MSDAAALHSETWSSPSWSQSQDNPRQTTPSSFQRPGCGFARTTDCKHCRCFLCFAMPCTRYRALIDSTALFLSSELQENAASKTCMHCAASRESWVLLGNKKLPFPPWSVSCGPARLQNHDIKTPHIYKVPGLRREMHYDYLAMGSIGDISESLPFKHAANRQRQLASGLWHHLVVTDCPERRTVSYLGNHQYAPCHAPN
ncbi:hypothetical protein B0H63DRAFT_228951 [Podospora didyma]|uniref:Uncharacterized protein n=1 Tax=Podospora didyma TaxID=330526 RepID=A0AAE0KJX9_9PEZI|nr:hypothetical protein B0H63DRAFT_228951 [Podospora didyma]